jgi:hypothetical protein
MTCTQNAAEYCEEPYRGTIYQTWSRMEYQQEVQGTCKLEFPQPSEGTDKSESEATESVKRIAQRDELTEEAKSSEVSTLASPKSPVSDKRRILPSVIVHSLTYLDNSSRVRLPSRTVWSLVRNIFEH